MILIFGASLTTLQTERVVAQSQPAQAGDSAAHKVPVVDGGAGKCSLELTVTENGNPVYAAVIKVHIAYGFGGFHKLDLEASTNIDGQAKFTGIPPRVRMPPLEFHATRNDLSGTATYNPATECQAKHDIALERPKSAAP